MSGPLVPRSFAAGLSRDSDARVATAEAVGSVVEQLGNVSADLAVVFVSGAHISQIDDVVDTVRSVVAPTTVLACSAAGVLGGGEEVEDDSAVAVWAGATGAVRPFRLEMLDARPDSAILGLPEELSEDDVLLVLADPFTFNGDALIQALEPGTQLVGGLVSSGRSPGENRIFLDHQRFDSGAVGVVLPHDAAALVVSQGCRPVGAPWVVTEASGNLIHQLAGRPAVERLRELVEELTPVDRQAAARGLHIGIVADEQRERFGRGDFLVRNVFGVEQESNALVVGDRVDVGRVVQFHVRDPASASEDLAALLVPGDGALVFTCNGRGTHLFDEPNHDARHVSEVVTGGVAGMFCAGELGPIGRRNALHGFTATVVTFGATVTANDDPGVE